MTAVALTATQRRVLTAMAGDELGLAAFTGEGSRRLGFAVLEAKAGGIIIRAYSAPEYFLKTRGLIDAAPRKCPGHWYRLTHAGRRAALKLRVGQ